LAVKVLRLAMVLLIGNLSQITASAGQEVPISLGAAKEQGRHKSRFLKEAKLTAQAGDAIAAANVEDFERIVGPVLTKSCLGCHGPKKAEGRLRVDQLNADVPSGPDIERWREVYNVLTKAEMPPDDSKEAKLSEEERGKIVLWLGEELHKASVIRRSSKAESSFRRLTKDEYNYALQDLLGVEVEFANKLPPETASEDGFKNRSDLLQMSATQFQAYREIGLNALNRAVVRGAQPQTVTYRILMKEQMKVAASAKGAKTFDKDHANYKKLRNEPHLLDRETGLAVHNPSLSTPPQQNISIEPPLPLSSVVWALPQAGELKLNLDRFLPDEGIMRVRIRAGRSSMNSNEYASLRLVFSAHTSNNASFSQTISSRDIPVTASAEAPEFIQFDIPLNDIQRNPFRKLATQFPRRDEFLHIKNISNAHGGEERLSVLINDVEICAPFYEQWPPRSHQNIFFESEHKGDERLYGREVLGSFLRRAWRRPVSAEEVDPYMVLFERYRPGFPNFEEAMAEVLATALASPEFLYLTPRRSLEGGNAGQSRIDELAFASRLAVFLWASLPDEELMQLAEVGKLREPAILTAQVSRMLEDPRSKRFSRLFVDQWLGLERINSVAHLNDGALREAMLAEPVALFEEVLKSGGSVMDFIDCNYAMLNERLAAHYQIPNIYGPDFRKVSITRQTNRGGLLTCAAMLTINSDGKDSHPVKRGVWLLQRILHDPPPPPPPNVPQVDLTDPEILKMTLKERIENHRNQPACASCHSRIDPWGVAFENYDALGVFRTSIKDRPVDATSELFSHQRLAGIDGLKRYLLMERQDQFAEAMVHKLTAYALGRPLSLGDRVDLEKLTAEMRRQNDRLSDLIQRIVSSDIFNSKE